MRETMAGGKLEAEWFFMDAKHNRVKGKLRALQIMGLSIYHPSLPQKLYGLSQWTVKRKMKLTYR